VFRHNASRLLGDQDHLRENLYRYLDGFSDAVRDIFDRFDFHTRELGARASNG